jgi:hypothetical protein
MEEATKMAGTQLDSSHRLSASALTARIDL